MPNILIDLGSTMMIIKIKNTHITITIESFPGRIVAALPTGAVFWSSDLLEDYFAKPQIEKKALIDSFAINIFDELKRLPDFKEHVAALHADSLQSVIAGAISIEIDRNKNRREALDRAGNDAYAISIAAIKVMWDKTCSMYVDWKDAEKKVLSAEETRKSAQDETRLVTEKLSQAQQELRDANVVPDKEKQKKQLLTDKLATEEKSNATLRLELQAATRFAEESRRTLSSAQTMNSELREILSALKKENQGLKEAQKQTRKENADLFKKLRGYESCDDLEQKRAKLEEDERRLSAWRDEIECRKIDLQDSRRIYSSEMQRQIGELKAARAEHEKREDEVQSVRSANRQLKVELEKVKKQLKMFESQKSVQTPINAKPVQTKNLQSSTHELDVAPVLDMMAKMQDQIIKMRADIHQNIEVSIRISENELTDTASMSYVCDLTAEIIRGKETLKIKYLIDDNHALTLDHREGFVSRITRSLARCHLSNTDVALINIRVNEALLVAKTMILEQKNKTLPAKLDVRPDRRYVQTEIVEKMKPTMSHFTGIAAAVGRLYSNTTNGFGLFGTIIAQELYANSRPHTSEFSAQSGVTVGNNNIVIRANNLSL